MINILKKTIEVPLASKTTNRCEKNQSLDMLRINELRVIYEFVHCTIDIVITTPHLRHGKRGFVRMGICKLGDLVKKTAGGFVRD